MRIKKLTESIEEANLDAYIVTTSPNIFYFTGSISGGNLIVSPETDPLLLTGRLNLSCALDQAGICDVKPYTRENMVDKIADKLTKLDSKRIGFDELSLKLYQDLSGRLTDVELKTEPDIVRNMRMNKDAGEVKMMRRAGELADIGMEAIKNCLTDGIRENEVAAEAAYAMRNEGADALAFPFIVVSGSRSAYPHGGVTDKKIRKGEFVTIDMGASYREYKTDITRTFIVGTPTEKQRTIYETVLEANLVSHAKIRDGIAGVDVHEAAMDVIERKGYGEYFIHGLGHGVGLEVHEGPSLSKTSKDILSSGNVVTNEPGIYIHGYGGVRIEDTVLITDKEPERLTKTPKDLDEMCV
jgi:Xaa-Pro aminopeptidase